MKYFGTAGIRGEYLSFVDPELAFKVGLAVARYNDSNSLINVGWDTRTTSKLLAMSVASGIMAGGSNALLLGMIPTPTLAYSVPKLKSKSGIMITASHNPPKDNGLKIFDDKGMEYTEEKEEKLEYMIESYKELKVTWDKAGDFAFSEGLLQQYLKDIYDRFSSTNPTIDLKIIVDCANGTGSHATPFLLRKMGAKIYSINCNPDGFFPGRHPEPRPDVLSPFKGLLATLNADLFLAHDGDADRLGVMTAKHGFLKQDYLIAIYALDKLSDKRGKIIVSPDVGNSVYEIAEKYGGKIIVGKLGKLHEKLLENPDAILVAEPWKLIDPQWGFWVDGIYQAAYLLSIVYKHKMHLDDMINLVPRYYWARGDITYESHTQKNKIYSLSIIDFESFKGPFKDIIKVDGLRINYEDNSWFLVRASGTEPKIRFYLEAKNKERFEELKQQILNIIKKNSEKSGISILDININEGY